MAAATHSQQLDDLTEIAHRLGLAFGRAAEAEQALDRKIELVNLFDRCFFSVRVGIALQLRLRKEARVQEARPEQAERPEPVERAEPSDALRYDERDRDREAERATLPLLLRTLEGVAADASALPGPPPAELPNLRELLAQVRGAEPAPAQAARTSSPPLRARLAGSTTALVLPLPQHPRPSVHRATGPP